MKRLTLSNALNSLKSEASLNETPTYKELFQYASLSVEIYKPVGKDLQQPHTRDEIYVIASGSGYFVNGDSRQPFEPGEVLFVKAGATHRFEDFSHDFSTWVFFFGPDKPQGTPAAEIKQGEGK